MTRTRRKYIVVALAVFVFGFVIHYFAMNADSLTKPTLPKVLSSAIVSLGTALITMGRRTFKSE